MEQNAEKANPTLGLAIVRILARVANITTTYLVYFTYWVTERSCAWAANEDQTRIDQSIN